MCNHCSVVLTSYAFGKPGEEVPMRCPDCNHNQKYKDGRRCDQCGYRFIFRNKDDKISDFALRQMIDRLSEQGQYCFTATQLALEICRYWNKKTVGPLGCGLIIVLVAAVIWFITEWSLPAGLYILLFVAVMLGFQFKRGWQRSVDFNSAKKVVGKYAQAHPIAQLAGGKAFNTRTEPENSEAYYAPERILIVESNEFADMLIRNRFPLLNKTAVVSRSGYPAQVFDACPTFLRNHPTIPVQLLHEASKRGFVLFAQIATDSRWQFARNNLVDLGLNRESLQRSSSLPWLPPEGHSATAYFARRHEQMLARGYRVPIDFMPPRMLLGTLATAITAGSLLLAAPNIADGVSLEVSYG